MSTQDTRAPLIEAAMEQGKTGITRNHTRIQARRDADELRAGWSAALERPKQHLERA